MYIIYIYIYIYIYVNGLTVLKVSNNHVWCVGPRNEGGGEVDFLVSKYGGRGTLKLVSTYPR